MKKLSAMTAAVRKKSLIAIAEELQEICEFKPPIKTAGVAESALKKKIEQAAGKLEEADELTEKTEFYLEELGFLVFADEDEDEDEDEVDGEDVDEEDLEDADEEDEDEDEDEGDEEDEPEDLEETVEATTKLAELRQICKDNPEFKSLRRKLAGFKKGSVLKKAMLELIVPDEEEEDDDEPTLMDTIEETTKLADLRQICKDNIELKSLRRKLATYKKGSVLKKVMLALISEDEGDEEDEVQDKPKASGTTKYGHKKNSFSGKIDEALIKAKKYLSAEDIVKLTGCKPYKAKSHIRHLINKCKADIVIKEGKYRLNS